MELLLQLRLHGDELAGDVKEEEEQPGSLNAHVLVAEGVFHGEDNAFAPLPPPEDEDVERLLRRMARRVWKLDRARHPDGLPWAEDAKAALTFECPCGGRRRVLALVTHPHLARKILGLSSAGGRPLPTGPPQLEMPLH